jgi:molybdopterin biosynthesis enzyme
MESHGTVLTQHACALCRQVSHASRLTTIAWAQLIARSTVSLTKFLEPSAHRVTCEKLYSPLSSPRASQTMNDGLDLDLGDVAARHRTLSMKKVDPLGRPDVRSHADLLEKS